MNFFLLHEDPCECAKITCDKHVVKMCTEHMQMLSTANFILNNINGPLKISFLNHPMTKWVCTSQENFAILCKYTKYLFLEYSHRYHKTHKLELDFYMLNPIDIKIDRVILSSIPQCMPEQYKVDKNPIEAYNNYYKGEKLKFATWKNRPIPENFKQHIITLLEEVGLNNTLETIGIKRDTNNKLLSKAHVGSYKLVQDLYQKEVLSHD